MWKRYFTLALIAVVFSVAPLTADQWDKKTVVTFNTPVQLPGIALPSGTYVFKLMDSLSNRNIVQVFNADESQVLTTILAIPNYRLEPTDETVLKFDERPRNTPDAIRAWFYPGDTFGQEFVYPKRQGSELAVREHVPVLITEAPPTAKPEELIKAPVTTAEPEKTTEVAEVATPLTGPVNVEPVKVEPVKPPEITPAAPVLPPAELPETASLLPLVALLGTLSLLLAALFRKFAKGF